jgi:U3 small nucleolar RNA-associated protein 19
MQDTFDPHEPDPMMTGAAESCLWELDTLTGHWHPNVATLACILKQQFTKEQYALEDFLDHSYASVCPPAEEKNIKKYQQLFITAANGV